MEKEHNHYIGDVVNGLAKEAAFWKAKAAVLEAEVMKLQAMVPVPKETAEEIHDIRRHG